MWPQLSVPRFSPEIEPSFQAAYYARVRSTLRLVAPLMVALLLVYLSLAVRLPTSYDLAVAHPQIAFWLLVLGLTWTPGFARYWQPVVVALGWLSCALVLGQLAPLLLGEVVRLRGAGLEPPTMGQQKFYFAVQFAVLVVSLGALRLQWRWAALLYAGVLAVGAWAFVTILPKAPEPFLDIRFVLLPSVLIVCVLMLASVVEERLARRAFESSRLLEEERNSEKRRREATEGKLQVLAQAIGSIVHDLGNPLTTVQMGASTLDLLLEEDELDKESLLDITGMIGSGAQMLNFLRLSLIEQARVLDGKPTPVDAKPVALRAIIGAGARFQKPHALGSRAIHIGQDSTQSEDDDVQVCADEMKMVTVFMNLIGNALKYSDGEVRVAWRPFQPSGEGGEKMLCIAIMDQGTRGRGLSREQAGRLFTAFGRLETHAQIEGTGLGLLSVRKIVAAQGGESFIEGHQDGTPGSPRFSTSEGSYPTMLSEHYRTAFVVTCPLA